MKHNVASSAVVLSLFAWLLGSVGMMPLVRGQSKGDPATGMLLATVNFQNNQEEANAFQAMKKGEMSATGPEARRILDDAAKWYAYRFTHQEYQQPKSGSKGMQQLRTDARDQVLNPRKPGKALTQEQVAFAGEFGKVFTARLREVADTSKPIARENAAMILADLAASGQEVAADALVEILRKPQENDAVKLWALRGLSGLFEIGANDDVDAFRDKEREARCIQALLDYLGERSNLPPGLPPEEVGAITYVRKEAVKALGQTRFPASAKLVRKEHVLERLTALALTRVLVGEGLVPEPSLKEQVFAAVALCRLQPRLCQEYQPDYAAYYTGRFVVDFVQRYTNEKDQKREPWKLLAAEMIKGLSKLRATLEGPPSHESFQYVNKIAAQADTLLREVVVGGATPSPTDLSEWLDKNPPKASSTYKGLASAVVQGGDKRPK